MKIFYPALITAAIFFGNIVVNLHDRNYGTVIFISLLAIPAILLQVLLSQKNFDLVGYLIILAPIITIYLGYSMGIQKVITVTPTTTPTTTATTTPTTTATTVTTTAPTTTAATTTVPTTPITSTTPAELATTKQGFQNYIPDRIEAKMT